MKTLFVTGASSGFGFAIAQRFLVEGWRAVVCARRFDRLQVLSSRFPDRVLALALDVTDRAEVARKVQELPREFANIDVLVNNAGLALGLAPAHAANLDDWDRMIGTNCSGLVHVTRAVSPGMVARKRGSIVNIGSIAGEHPYPGGNVYGATKAFVHQFTQNLNADLIGTGVRASCVEPGLCSGTEFSKVRFDGDEERAQAVYAGTTPLTAEDIADTVYWIATRPPHVTINVISMMPNCQSFGPFAIKRNP
jgi:3-hydroxy acid dehydrogenase / malonic semialdehyde reductase